MQDNDKLRIRVDIEIAPHVLQTIVETAKKIAGKNEKGYFQVDTADIVSQLISQFLGKNDFETYARDERNYSFQNTK